jgi:hypothetical protein
VNKKLSVLCLFGVLAGAAAVHAETPVLRERTSAQRPSLLVLGVSHFANPGADRVNVKFDDVLAPNRQREIEAVVEALAAYKPTHVAVEFPVDQQDRLDARYRDYLAGKYTLTRNEVDQVGLRLAARLGLPRVDAADWNEFPPGTEADFDYIAWANQHNEQARLERVSGNSRAIAQEAEALLARSTLGGYLCALNEPEALARNARAYFDIALFGDAKVNPGAVYTGNWYARNLRVFANLVRIAPKPEDRIVAIYGAGHKPLLDRYAAESLAFKVDDARAVLRCP